VTAAFVHTPQELRQFAAHVNAELPRASKIGASVERGTSGNIATAMALRY
jgi:hypothetical protein